MKMLIRIDFNAVNKGNEVTFGKVKPYTYTDRETGDVKASASFKVYVKTGDKLKSFDLNVANYSIMTNSFKFYKGGKTTVNVYDHDTKTVSTVNREVVLKKLFGYIEMEVGQDGQEFNDSELPF